jgi:NADPH:quinone reductase-like Zn-dependent oxidoreductase
VLGGDVAGQVEAVGSNVKQFKPGDEVFGYLPSATGRGTFTEYVCANENVITLKPANLTFEQVAAVPMAALTALQGTFAVQIAKAFGAEVTAVSCNPCLSSCDWDL